MRSPLPVTADSWYANLTQVDVDVRSTKVINKYIRLEILLNAPQADELLRELPDERIRQFQRNQGTDFVPLETLIRCMGWVWVTAADHVMLMAMVFELLNSGIHSSTPVSQFYMRRGKLVMWCGAKPAVMRCMRTAAWAITQARPPRSFRRWPCVRVRANQSRYNPQIRFVEMLCQDPSTH